LSFRSTDDLRDGMPQGALIVIAEPTEALDDELGLDGEQDRLYDARHGKTRTSTISEGSFLDV
jgi:hypothetical protein